MCGVAGIIDSSKTLEVNTILRTMVESLTHRGPDSQGIESFNMGDWCIGLGHTRLAILDLSYAGHQPMSIDDDNFWITYNGEIYNFRDLRETLNDAHSNWRSRTDTEVILRGYQKWGLDILHQLRGMFAFALWDRERQKLFLVRDPLGIKPLYYFQDGNTFLFASEIRALLATGLVSRHLSVQGLTSYLQYGSIQAPWTAIEGIRSLLPGHYLVVDLKEQGLHFNEISYASDLFQPQLKPKFSDYRNAVEKLSDLLKESIRLHLVSDVPLGVFLSGGIDSSAIVALMSQVVDERPKTFSVVFSEKKFSEATYARKMADMYQTDHQEIPLSEGEILQMLPFAIEAMDQPTMDGINTFVVSKSVKEAGVTVALSGLGGDELFAGYPSFSRARLMQMMVKIPRRIRLFATAVGCKVISSSISQRKFWELVGSDGTARAAYVISRELFTPSEIGSLMLEPPHFHQEIMLHENQDDPIKAVSEFELLGYTANTLLRDTDFMSMAHALEVRVPFLDPVLVRFVIGLPLQWKFDGKRPKPLLLDALDGLLPEEIWQRPKMGFTLPFERWMQTTLKTELENVLSQGKGLESFGLESNSVRRIWQTFQKTPRRERWSRAWALYIFKKWCDLNRVEL